MRSSKNDKGIAQVINDLSNPPSYNPGFGTIPFVVPTLPFLLVMLFLGNVFAAVVEVPL